MPLGMAPVGEEVEIKRVTGKPDVKRHLEDLGFTPGAKVTLLSKSEGNLILKLKDSRLALGEEMAKKILI